MVSEFKYLNGIMSCRLRQENTAEEDKKKTLKLCIMFSISTCWAASSFVYSLRLLSPNVYSPLWYQEQLKRVETNWKQFFVGKTLRHHMCMCVFVCCSKFAPRGPWRSLHQHDVFCDISLLKNKNEHTHKAKQLIYSFTIMLHANHTKKLHTCCSRILWTTARRLD